MATTPHIIAPLTETHTHTIIFLHGKGSEASEFASELFESQASDDRIFPEIFPSFKWVFPQSKIRMSTRFESEESQWFDIWAVENPSEKEEIQVEGLLESMTEILKIVRHQASIVPQENVFLAGISQGCAVAIHALLCGNVHLGRFIGLSSWLPFPQIIQNLTHDISYLESMSKVFEQLGSDARLTDFVCEVANNNLSSAYQIPTFLSHSEDDNVVPIVNGRELRDTLAGVPNGLRITWKEYEDGSH